jgi:hypothetical protein
MCSKKILIGKNSAPYAARYWRAGARGKILVRAKKCKCAIVCINFGAARKYVNVQVRAL